MVGTTRLRAICYIIAPEGRALLPWRPRFVGFAPTCALFQLTVLAPPAVEAAGAALRVAPGLARHTSARAWQRPAPSFRNRLATFVAAIRAFAGRHVGPRQQDRVLHRIVDLVLH